MLRQLPRPHPLLSGVMAVLIVAAVACSTEEQGAPPPDPVGQEAPPAQVEDPTPEPEAALPDPTAKPTAIVVECATQLARPGRGAYPARGRVRYEDGLPLEEEQTLKVAIKSDIRSLRPWTSGTDIGRSYNSWVFMGLTQFGGQKGELRAGVATGYTLDDDGVTYTWCLDPDAIYHDGTPVTAQSIKHAWEWSAYPEQQVTWGGNLREGMRLIKGFDEVEAGAATEASGLVVVGDHTLQTVLAGPHPAWPSRLAIWLNGVFKAECYEEDMSACNVRPVGVGPYEAEIDPATGAITLTASENWWRTPPTVTRVEMTVVQDQASHQTMLESNELDIVYADSFETPWAFDLDSPLWTDLHQVSNAGMWTWVFDTTKPPFDDLNVWAAITHAIDWEKIAQMVFQPRPTVARGFQGEHMLCFNSDYSNKPYGGYDYDPEMAQASLAESEYDLGDFPRVVVAMNLPRMVTAMEMARDMVMENLGIDITVIALRSGQQQPPDANIYLHAAGSNIPDPSSLMTELGHSANSAGYGSNHINPELDSLIDRANSLSIDDPGRCAAFQEAEQFFYQQYYTMMGLGLDDMSWLARPWLIDFEVTFGLDWASLPWTRIGKRDPGLWK